LDAGPPIVIDSTRKQTMNRSLAASLRLGLAGVAAIAIVPLGLTSSSAWAQAPAPAAPAAAPPPDQAAPAAPTSPLTAPSMAGPITANPTPMKFDAGPLDSIYVSGVASGLALFQTNPTTVFLNGGPVHDHTSNFDFSNGQVIIQKIDGLVQFYAQAGAYSLPSLGTNYYVTQRAGQAIGDYFGPLPEGYVKLVPSDIFSVQAGKLPTLIGAEYTFTFENMNIERGLLWNQEPAISKGVQANLTTGPVAWSVSWNDGFYSDRYNWVDGSATWTIDPANTLEVVGGGNVGSTGINTIASPFFQNNSDIINLIYTYNNAPFTITPYLQYTSVPKNLALGATKGASTWGGAVLANYAFADTPFNLAGRFEYISSDGSLASGNANVLGYGPGSSAVSFTLTPTYQQGIFFARVEGSYVGLNSTTPGAAFGHNGTAKSQERLLFEAGVVF
jgi:hypothetical protein